MRKVLFSAVSPGMAYSSLGYAAVFAGLAPCHHAWLDVDGAGGAPRVVETGSTLWPYDVVLVSAAWELEVPALARALRGQGIEPFAHQRPSNQPLLIGGGPLTLSNPDLLAAVCDAVFAGEADDALPMIADALDLATGRDDLLVRLSQITGMWVPTLNPLCPPPVVVALPPEPLCSAFPGCPNEFSNSFIVEVGRGCPRGCDFCVAFGGRRGRFYPAGSVLDAIPEGVSRVGLLGAAVSDHPELMHMVRQIHDRGIGVTLGSLRADRVTPELVSMLAAGGLRTLTVAADGASESIRRSIHKGVTADHLMNAAVVARQTGIERVRVYVMLGLPDETPDDLREFADLINAMSAGLRIVVSVSPFVPKRFTRLSDAPFAGVSTIRRSISTLKRMLGPRVELRSGPVKEAELEHRLSNVRLPDAPALLSSLISG